MLKRILIINIFGIGDVLFTTPLIRNIKANLPAARIDYVANRRTAVVLENNPNIEKVFIYEKDEYKEIYRKSKITFFRQLVGALNDIKENKYDLVIDLSLNSYAGLFMWLVGIPQRIGFNYKNRSPFLTKKIKFRGYEGRHVIDYYLNLLEEIGLKRHSREMEITVTQEDQTWAENFVEKHGKDKKMFVGIVPGGGASWGKDAVYKLWPAEKYAKLADKIVEKFSAEIILFGDKADQELCSRISTLSNNNLIQACGQTSIRQCAALFKQCAVVVVNDGGPLHIAVAAGVRTVSIFGPVDENVYGPYPIDRHEVVTAAVPCRPCYRQFRRASCEHISCLKQIEVEEVFAEVEQIL